MTISTPVERAFKRRDLIAASSGFAVPLCAILAVGVVCCIYVYQNYAGKGQPFAWFDGTSLWPSIAIFLLAALLSVHFIVKIHFQLKQNAKKRRRSISQLCGVVIFPVADLGHGYHAQRRCSPFISSLSASSYLSLAN